MDLAINGYGRMGKLIESMAQQAGHTVVAVIDPVSEDEAVTAREVSPQALHGAQVVIDFSIPSAAVDTIRKCAECGVSVVMGTTGWYEQMDMVHDIIQKSSIGLIWSGNFSLGVNILFSLVRSAAKMMNQFSEYDCMVHEYHHRFKADSPSGTAAMIGSVLLEELDRKKRVVTDSLSRPIEEAELHVSSTRGGAIPGTHTVIFDSPVDSLEITHRARNREGFAVGAVKAAEWIADRTGMYSIDDMMAALLGGE